MPARKRKSMPRWLAKLDAKDRKHLKESGVTTLSGFKHNRDWQHRQEREWQRRHGGPRSPWCLQCDIIAIRLGLD